MMIETNYFTFIYLDLAKSMQAKDADSFWKNVSKTYKKGIPNATNVNGDNDPTAISAMWKTHFESLLNNVTTDANLQNVKECVQNICIMEITYS